MGHECKYVSLMGLSTFFLFTYDNSSVGLKTSAAPIKLVTANPRVQSFICL